MATINSLLTQHSSLLKIGGDEVKISSSNIQIGVNNGCNLIKTGSNNSSYAIQKGNISSTDSIRVVVIDTPDGSRKSSIKILENVCVTSIKKFQTENYVKSIVLFLNDPVGNKAISISFSGYVNNVHPRTVNNDLVEYHVDIILYDTSSLKLE